ncbi:TetR/AcrR family transcriptional regulator [Clostridium lacusfryxellense]|uniref:TetR/AcrR family transcriptional regulator n=1 Tax=Clostridium lacusfryxellense TaxID=205328 RepID=UPI001C0B03D5|nr:TetR/AcrR family transcriptional regulator [Clostridium lacusfryxellense]MBU3112553.1 TetR/AcrR family transcriptional regulator [Clostridium lacusfryxellense]
MSITQRKEKEHLVRKNDMINAAERVFFEKGFENSTMDDIAKSAGFTKKTIYSYFKSKEELYYEIMLLGFKTLNDLYDKTISKNTDKTEIENIKELGHTFVSFSRDYPGYFKAISDYENKDFDFQVNDSHSLIKDCYIAGEYSFNLLNNCIINGIKKGEILASTDSNLVCIMLWSTMLGLIGLINKKEKYIKTYHNKGTEELMDDGFELLLRAIKK